jgi:hypothetical protein
MHPVLKWLLALASFSFASIFIWLGISWGPFLKQGGGPFYVTAAFGIIVCWYAVCVRSIPIGQSLESDDSTASSPENPLSRQAEDLDDASVWDVDLMRVSPAGCFLCVTTAIVLFLSAGAAAVFPPGMIENRATEKIVGWSILGVGAAYFLMGRYILKQFGFTFLRKRK